MGNPNSLIKGQKKLIIKSSIPDVLSIPIATKSPIIVGKIFHVVFIPSFAPFKKISNTSFFSFNPYKNIIKIINGIAKLEK